MPPAVPPRKPRLLIVGDYDDWSDDRRTITVLEDETPPPTGLLDENGMPLRKARHPIGFMR